MTQQFRAHYSEEFKKRARFVVLFCIAASGSLFLVWEGRYILLLLFAGWLVRRDVDRIFDYRAKRISEILTSEQASTFGVQSAGK